jgi:hypothetical protein
MRQRCLCMLQVIHVLFCITDALSFVKSLWKSKDLFLVVLQAWRVAKCVFCYKDSDASFILQQ